MGIIARLSAIYNVVPLNPIKKMVIFHGYIKSNHRVWKISKWRRLGGHDSRLRAATRQCATRFDDGKKRGVEQIHSSLHAWTWVCLVGDLDIWFIFPMGNPLDMGNRIRDLK